MNEITFQAPLNNVSPLDLEFYKYCCLDSCVTHEITTYLTPRVTDRSKLHYLFNLGMLLPLRYMSLKGFLYNSNLARTRRVILLTKMFESQARLNGLTGFGFEWQSIKEIQGHIQSLMCKKDGQGLLKAYKENYDRLIVLLSISNPTLATIGEIEDLCEVSLNEGSNKVICAYLYNTLKLPIQLSDPDPLTNQRNPTADYEALIKLSKYCQKEKKDIEFQIVQLCLEIRAIDTRQRNLACSFDNDDRMRFSFNIVGSKTGRTQCKISTTGNGRPGQGIPKYSTIEEAPGGILGDRDLFLADPDYYIAKCDLEGADSWTVAAYCALLGDPTMINDLRAGVRPAKKLCLKLRGININYHDPQTVLEASKSVSKDSWDYFACKRVVHGASYGEGEVTIHRSIIRDSEGKMFMEISECRKLKEILLKNFYPGIVRRFRYIEHELKTKGRITCASGHTRIFFGKPAEVFTEALAEEPQHNTTWILKLALQALCNDPDNWHLTRHRSDISFEERWLARDDEMHIQPLHLVHDELVCQFKKSNTPWAIPRIRHYFNNPVTIAGISLTIPYEGSYGEAWGGPTVGKI